MKTETKPETVHERITHAMERCRNGRDLHIELAETTVSIRCEKQAIGHQFYVSDGEEESPIGGIAVWKLIANHEIRIGRDAEKHLPIHNTYKEE